MEQMVLVDLLDELHLNVDKGHATLLLVLDLSVAFDVWHHSILSKHLEAEVTIRGCALVWSK